MIVSKSSSSTKVGIHKPARRRHNLDRLFAEQPARHVEIVNRHVAKNSAGMTNILTRRQSRVAAGDDDLAHVADFAGIDGSAQLPSAGIKATVECHHDAAVEPLDLKDSSVHLGKVEVDRLLAKHGLSHLHGMKHQTDMGIRRCADDNGIDIGSLNRRDRIKRGLTTKMIGQVPGRAAKWIGNRDKLCIGICRHIGRMDFPNSSSTKNRNAQHLLETPVYL